MNTDEIMMGICAAEGAMWAVAPRMARLDSGF
jgi:hypothetical protein